MRHVIWAVCFLTVLFIAPAGGQQHESPAAKVVTTTVREAVVSENAPVTCTLHLDTVGRLSSEVSGLVQSVSFTEGHTVKMGDVLFRPNTNFIDREIELVRIRSRQLDIKIENVEKDLERTGRLYKESATSEKTYDDLRSSLREL